MLAAGSTLIDVAFAVCTALDAIAERALLVGGSAATFYAPAAYQSRDCDFILTFGANSADITAALATIGFTRSPQNMFHHADVPFTVEFPKGPAFIGIDCIETFATVHRGDELLHVYTPTDVVRDRLMHFWAWGDFSALRVALDVAAAQQTAVDFDAIRSWTDREIANAPAAYNATRRDLFLGELRAALGRTET